MHGELLSNSYPPPPLNVFTPPVFTRIHPLTFLQRTSVFNITFLSPFTLACIHLHSVCTTCTHCTPSDVPRIPIVPPLMYHVYPLYPLRSCVLLVHDIWWSTRCTAISVATHQRMTRRPSVGGTKVKPTHRKSAWSSTATAPIRLVSLKAWPRQGTPQPF